MAPIRPAAAEAGAPDRLESGGTAAVAGVVDGDTVMLADGRQVRLTGLQAPKLALGRAGFRDWPLAEAARAALEEIAGGHAVTLRHGGARLDRHGRVLAHLVRGDGLWVQGEMLRRGMARVYTFSDNRALAAEMLALEGEARAARRGIWDHPFYAVRTQDETDRHIDTFQVIEGRVLDAVTRSGRIYLNFGADWRTDFTVTIAPRHRRPFLAAGLDPESLSGALIRVRGWLISRNGPMIEATHPEQIERLPEPGH